MDAIIWQTSALWTGPAAQSQIEPLSFSQNCDHKVLAMSKRF